MMTEQATYCPEDNKIRLYVGRVPRDEYLKLRKNGWISTPKQACDFVAVWTTRREDTALEYSGGIIEDEDQSPEDRAADRAERFANYADKREGEALQLAGRYESGPAALGYQSQALAERKARAIVRTGTHAVNQWEKAEYWTQRTAGVISNALHKAAPGVRMGRIKKLETELRKSEKNAAEYAILYKRWQGVRADQDQEHAQKSAVMLANYFGHGYGYKHPRPEGRGDYEREHGTSLYDLLTSKIDPITAQEAAALWLEGRRSHSDLVRHSRWLNHYKLRLAYENQMLASVGGRAAFVEMEPGGWVGNKQIQRVNKSPVTGRVVSVKIWGNSTGYTKESGYKIEETRPCLMSLNVERLKSEIYRPPTDEEREAFIQAKKDKKKAAPKVSFINPTLEDAERLQAQLNTDAATSDKGKNYPRKPGAVYQCTQIKFSKMYKDYKTTRVLDSVKIRVRVGSWSSVDSVVMLTDKPQKAIPATFWKVA